MLLIRSNFKRISHRRSVFEIVQCNEPTICECLQLNQGDVIQNSKVFSFKPVDGALKLGILFKVERVYLEHKLERYAKVVAILSLHYLHKFDTCQMSNAPITVAFVFFIHDGE